MDRGAQVRTARIARGLSQQRLATLAGVSIRTVRSIERGATGSPHRHSLERIAGALRLTAGQTADFLSLWAPEAATSKLAPVVGRTLDVDAYLGTGNRPLNEGTRVVSSSASIVVDAAGLSVHSEWILLLEARSRPVGHHWLLWGDDETLDANAVTADVIVGGTVAALVPLPGHDLLALRVALAPELRPGEIRQLRVRWNLPHRAGAQPPDENEFAMGWRDVPHLTTVAVTFTGPPPSKLWTIAGPNPAGLRIERPMTTDPTGTASVTRHVDEPGMLGLRWRS